LTQRGWNKETEHMPNQTPEQLQEIVNIAFYDLAGPLSLMHNWAEMVAQAQEEQDEEYLQQCIGGLLVTSRQIQELWDMMRDLYLSETKR
jgi:hypothetical protein